MTQQKRIRELKQQLVEVESALLTATVGEIKTLQEMYEALAYQLNDLTSGVELRAA
jgi:hypothetical protein